jgi:ATP-dependent protease HslVU (ClpYQ) peptidase subunit
VTCIAWDGTTLAADKRSTCVGYPHTVTKIHRVPGGLVGLAGNASHAMAVLQWFKTRRDPATWPKPPEEGACDTIFISDDGEIYEFWGKGGGFYERYENKFTATGSGRDYALAAMELGKTAREAVELACKMDIFCGNGIDTLELGE